VRDTVKPRAIHADALLPGDQPPMVDAALVVDGAGTVVDVGSAAAVLPRHAGIAVERVHGVVFPGLNNAHTHIELSALRGRVQGARGFVPWVDTLIALRTELADDETATAMASAVDELVTRATVAVGDVTNTLLAVEALAQRGLGGCIFHEMFGLDGAAARARIEELSALRTARFGSLAGLEDLAFSSAPHTLYTTHEDAVRALFQRARERGERTTLHLAEHPAERLAIESGEGPLPDWLFARTSRRPNSPHAALFDYAERTGALDPSVLLVHLAEATPAEFERVAKSGASVVLCPRSNVHIEGRMPPLRAVRAAGIEAALGTDSLASNASLDVLAEAKAFADAEPSVAAWELVRMATWNGARALGRADLGRLSRGAKPGVYAVAWEKIHADPALFLLNHLLLPRHVLVSRVASECIG
jgi:cytosine/adenosine deaminase-related metal-dependent hydrolase